jgi:hypothetical protein
VWLERFDVVETVEPIYAEETFFCAVLHPASLYFVEMSGLIFTVSVQDVDRMRLLNSGYRNIQKSLPSKSREIRWGTGYRKIPLFKTR